MRTQHLKTLVSITTQIAPLLTKMNERSLLTFHRLTSAESLTDLLQTRRTYNASTIHPYITNYFVCNTGHTEKQALVSFALHILTVEMPTLGKDLLRALTTGRFENTSNFVNAKNSPLPKFMYECFIHIFDKDGYIRSNHSDIAALRQILMMYYKFELPFTREQELEAHTKFIETDKLVKIDLFPNLEEVSRYFKSCLPDDPWDIRPHHSNGATNTTGVDNSTKRSLTRYNNALFGLYGRYFNNDSVYLSDTSTFNSKLTVVPKDSRGPRTICMEPHERMFIQKGLMQKIYDFIEFTSPARGYINFRDQGINQALAYRSSIDGSYATIDLKDASDLVSWPLLTKILHGTDWLQALDVTRSTHTTTLFGDHKLAKFAPMGSALCFPIEAILFWSIAKTVSPIVYVYGDDIIVPTLYASKVMSALEIFGLVINVDKSLTTGFFKESCGGDYFHGHNVGIIQCRSLDFVSFAEFINLIDDKFSNRGLQSALTSLYEQEYKHYFPRTNSSDPLSGFVKTNSLACNDVFLKRRYNTSLQRFEYRVLASDTIEICNPSLTDYHLYQNWLNESTNVTSLLEATLIREDNLALNKSFSSFFDISFSGKNQLVKKREKLKFTWTPCQAIYLPNTLTS